MAVDFTDYSGLCATIANYLARSDLTADIPGLVNLAESRIQRELRVRQMETIATTTLTAGDPYASVPGDFLEARSFVLQSTPLQVLAYQTPSDLAASYPTALAGKPRNFSIIGAQFKVGPTPDAAYTAELIYYAKIPPLASNGTNWVLRDYPDLYLYATLIESAPFIKNDARLQVWLGFYDRAIAAVKGEDARARWNGAPVAMKLDVTVG